MSITSASISQCASILLLIIPTMAAISGPTINLGPSIGTNLDYDYNLIQCEGIACKPAQYIVTSLQTDCIVMLLK